MLGTLYIPYLLVLLIVPVLVRWRRGLVASLIVVVVELGVVALIFYLLNTCHVFPDPFAGEPPPRAPMEVLRNGRERSAIAFFHLVALVLAPAAAALIGGGLAVLWSVVVVGWRMVAQRANSQ